MKKLVVFVLNIFFIQILFGQVYQLPNGGFESWDNNSIPVGWHTFNSATGSYAGFASTNHHERESARPGSSGQYSLKIYSTSVMGVVANGNMTTGRINAGSMSASGSENYNYSDRSNGYAQVFTGTPDSMYVWTKLTAASSSTQGEVRAYIHGNSNFIDPKNCSDKSLYKGYARVIVNTGNTWTQKKMAFVYDGTSTANYMLVTLNTNITPGGGSSGDALYIDDIEMIYSAWLTDIKLDGTTVPGFNMAQFDYYKVFPRGTNRYDYSLLPSITYTSQVSDVTMIDSLFLGADNSIYGATHYIQVTAEDGVTQKLYAIHYSIYKSSDNTLTSFSYSDNGSISGTQSVSQDTTHILLPPGTTVAPQITACTLADTGARYTVAQTTQAQGGIATITVTAENGQQKNYYVCFSVQPSSNADLSAIYYNGIAIPNFHQDSLDYHVVLPPGTQLEPFVTATTAWPGLTPSIVQPSSLPGSATIVVTAEDRVTQKTYHVYFTVGLSTNTQLANIKYNNIFVSPFYPDTLNYTIDVAKTETQIVVAATPAWPTATVSIVQPTSIPGMATITVKAEDTNYTQTYTLNFVYQRNNNANLSQLTYNIGLGDTLVPEFDPLYYSYIVQLPEGSTVVPVIAATAQDSAATVEITQAQSINDTAYVKVTAENRITVLNYMVVFKVAQSVVATLDSIWVDSVALVGFDPNKLIYNYQLDSVYMPYVRALATHQRATVSIVYPQRIPGQVQIVVTAEDTTVKKIYRINCALPTSNDARLLDLGYTLGGVDFALPNFHPDTLLYHVLLPSQTIDTPVLYCQSADFSASVTVSQPANPNGVGLVLVIASDNSTYNLYQVYFEVNISNNTKLQQMYYESVYTSNPDTTTQDSIGTHQWVKIPVLNPDTLYYSVELPYNWADTVAPILMTQAQSSAAKVYITQAQHYTDSAVIVVVAEDNATVNRYIVHFYRQASPIATLESIAYQLNGQDSIVHNVNATTLEYVVDIAAETLSVPDNWTFVLTDPRSRAYVSKSPTKVNDTAEITVVAENNIDSTVYRVIFNYLPSSNTALQCLIVNGDTLQDFYADTLTYAVIIPWEDNRLPQITAVAQWQYGTTIQITPPSAVPGSAQVRVVAQNGVDRRDYMLNFYKGSNSDLNRLTYIINGVEDTIAGFNPQDTLYHILLPIATTDTPSVNYTLVDNRSTVVVAQPDSPNDTATVYIVGWDSLTAKTYKVIFEVELSKEALLADLRVDNVTIDNFHADSLHYAIEYTYGHDTLYPLPVVTAVATQADARVEITQISQYPQQATVTVYAGDTSIYRTYTIDFSVEAGDNNYLSEFLINGMSFNDYAFQKQLVPAFDKNVYTYYAEYIYGQDSIDVTPQLEDGRATVIVDYEEDTASARKSTSIHQTVKITIVALNGDRKEYRIHFADLTLSNISVDNQAIENFKRTSRSYTYQVSSSYDGVPAVTFVQTDTATNVEFLPAEDVATNCGTTNNKYRTRIIVSDIYNQLSKTYIVRFCYGNGIAENQLAQTKVYPNPCQDKMVVEVEENNIGCQIVVYNTEGKEVLNTVLNDTKNILSVQHLTKGFYVYKIVASSQLLGRGKFIKQ